MKPFEHAEVLKALRSMGESACGPDRLSVKVVKKIPINVLIPHFTLWTSAEYLPEQLLKWRTVFIPKEEGTLDPLKFRPITIASVITRCLHKILADRISGMVTDNPRQRGFKQGEGTAENLAILQCVIAECKRERRSAKIALVNIVKAFDSVTHQAIAQYSLVARADPKLIRFVMKGYARQSSLRREVSTDVLRREIECKAFKRGKTRRPLFPCTV